MKKTLILLLILIVLVMAPLSACQDMRNIDDEAHALSLGIDIGNERRFRFTVQIPSQTAATALEGGFTLHSAEADSIYEAIDMINTSLPWRLNFTHLNFILFSEELAKQGYLKEFMRPSPRHLGFRITCSMMIAKGSASEFLEGTRGLNDINLAKHQRTWMIEPNKSALFPECTYIELGESLKSPIFTSLMPLGAVNLTAEAGNEDEAKDAFSGASEAIFDESFSGGEAVSPDVPERTTLEAGTATRMSPNTSEIMGCALIDDGRMVGEFDANATLVLMLARDQFEQGWYYYTDQEHSVADLRIDKNRKVTITSWDPLKISLDVYIKGDIAAGLGTDIYKDEKAIAHIESKISQCVHDEMVNLFQDCQYLGVDAFELGKSAIKSFYTNDDWNAYNWREKLKDAELDIRVEFKLNRYNVPSSEGIRIDEEPADASDQGSSVGSGEKMESTSDKLKGGN